MLNLNETHLRCIKDASKNVIRWEVALQPRKGGTIVIVSGGTIFHTEENAGHKMRNGFVQVRIPSLGLIFQQRPLPPEHKS